MENKSNDWMYALVDMFFLLALADDSEPFKKIWRDFENEVSHQNRYFPNSERIVKIIESFYDRAVYKLPNNKIVYRARIIKDSELPNHTKDLLSKYETKTLLGDISGIKTLGLLSNSSRCLNENDSEKSDVVLNENFWGFDSEKSDAPPKENASAGRINPHGISHLYAAESAHTAIVETRPIIGQMISVAEIEINKELNLFDFCDILNDDVTKGKDWILLHLIAQRFSTPNHNGDIGYFSTQYVSEMLKSKFDGVRFSSSLHMGGRNIVLFDVSKDDEGNPRNYKIKNSSIHWVSDITITQNKLIPKN